MFKHILYNTDARNLNFIEDKSVHLVLTSPPYWNLKPYKHGKDQLGLINDYEVFLQELDKVWLECYRVLVNGGRLVCVVGDVCLSRRKYGRHVVMPLHADIQSNCRKIGFDNLNPILWYKISNIEYEANTSATFLGKPYEPNGIIKNDVEYILMQRKPGGYRKPSLEQREKSKISKEDYSNWFRQIWSLPGASTKKHPAPFPNELASRLIKMFSFHGDTVLDPFCGSGTTMEVSAELGRNSIGIETEIEYCELIDDRMKKAVKKYGGTYKREI